MKRRYLIKIWCCLVDEEAVERAGKVGNVGGAPIGVDHVGTIDTYGPNEIAIGVVGGDGRVDELNGIGSKICAELGRKTAINRFPNLVAIFIGGVVGPVDGNIAIVDSSNCGAGSRHSGRCLGGERKWCGGRGPSIGTSGIDSKGLPIVGNIGREIGGVGKGGCITGEIGGAGLGILARPVGLRRSFVESLAVGGHSDVGTKHEFIAKIIAVGVKSGHRKSGSECNVGGGIDGSKESHCERNVTGGKRVWSGLGGAPDV